MVRKKKCIRCRLALPHWEFYRHPDMPDGTVNKCKDCQKIEAKERYRRKREEILRYDRKRSQTKRTRLVHLKSQRKRNTRWPDKYKARNKLNNALRDGKIQKPERCDVCRRKRKIEAHHNDYSKPLEVIWMCFECHRKHHGQLIPF
jgi:hypothetical protein